MSGISVITIYSSQIFNKTGINEQMGTFVIGISNILGIITSMLLINRKIFLQQLI